MKIQFSHKRIRPLCLCALAIFLAWVIWGNTALERTTYTITDTRLPAPFNGFRIAQVSDLHNARMGTDNCRLLEMLESAEPDIIAITGDLIDSSRTDTETALLFVEKALEIAPCYYVTGNHEGWVSQERYRSLETRLTALGVTVLHDAQALIDKDGAQISLIGIDDPDFAAVNGGGVGITMLPNRIQSLAAEGNFTVLLSHRPEYFTRYAAANVNLVLSGHAHGGQFRLPFIGGLIAPNQGLFPEYDAGYFTENGTSMVVSRGIGNSIIPIRFCNRPELVVIELQTQ